MTHKPSGKIYIGSLKHDDRWGKYLTSSNTVKPMLKANPEEWHREILLKDFSPITTWSDVVSLEQSIIEATSKTIGWKGMWNKGVYRGQIKLAEQTTMPVDHPWRTNPPWNKGVKGAQSMPDHHPWRTNPVWNKCIKMTAAQTKNYTGFDPKIYAPEIIEKRVKTCQNTRANWTPEQKAENNRKVSLGKIEGWKRKKAALIKSD